MPRYIKDTPRIDVKFVNGDTDEILFEVPNRSWMDVGEILSTINSDRLIQTELKNKKLPKKVIVITVSELYLSQ